MTYLKQLNNNGYVEWRLYNDSSQVQRYRGWIDILNQVLELGQQPTLLIYEKLTPKNMQYDRNEQVTYSDLVSIFQKQKELQEPVDAFY